MSAKISVTDAERVDITTEEYSELVRASERIAVVERLAQENKYINTDDVMTILNIKKEERKIEV
jgi:hypothetical protein